jgi:hypothetical protein
MRRHLPVKKKKIMKKITKITTILCLSCVMLLGIQSCQKYEDGPLFSLMTKTSRLSNNWKIDNYKVNDVDLTSLLNGYTETFTTDHNYSYTWGILGGTGTWAFQNNYAEVRITGTSNQSDVTLYILKLEKTQFWYYIIDGNDRKEYHMVQE